MNLKIETVEEKQSFLIVSKKNYPFIEQLKNHLKKYNGEVYFSSKPPKNFGRFDYCFLIEDSQSYKLIDHLTYNKIIFIFFDKKKTTLQHSKKLDDNIKTIVLNTDHITIKDIDKILWFSFSKTKEHYLNIYVPDIKPVIRSENKIYHHNFIPQIKTKNLIIVSVVLFLISQIIYIIPLSLSSYFFYYSAKTLKGENLANASKNLTYGELTLNATKKLYSFSRPIWLLFSLALIPDNIIDINDKAKSIINQSISIMQNSQAITKLILNKNKNDQELKILTLRINKIKDDVNSLEGNLALLNQKLPNNISTIKKIKQELLSYSEVISKFKKLFPHLDTFLAKNSEKKYLLLFANNMELRPGGGFIGSFGILTIKNYTIMNIQIYDVYDADGQLIAHIDPPQAIRKYLQLPHWFLRDSAFSPDFLENYAQAKYFLNKELGMTGFSGAVLITTTGIEHLLDAFGNIYLPDFDEKINRRNFYLMTQVHAEKDFFPGSIQKKSFLLSLVNQLFINLENASIKNLITGIKKSLDEKQMTIFMDDPSVQTLIDSYYWSGRVIQSGCTVNNDNCIVDYIFPFDANLGVNKANFFVNRMLDLSIDIDSKGIISHKLSIKFKNESPGDVFPVGTYKNYFQIYLPIKSNITAITKNDVMIDDIDEKIDQFKVIGFYFEIAPMKTAEIIIKYNLDIPIKKGRGIYQLVIQKQIGSSNNDLSLDFHFANNIHLLSQNFSPLVKNNLILYNTNLSADKIFFTELTRE